LQIFTLLTFETCQTIESKFSYPPHPPLFIHVLYVCACSMNLSLPFYFTLSLSLSFYLSLFLFLSFFLSLSLFLSFLILLTLGTLRSNVNFSLRKRKSALKNVLEAFCILLDFFPLKKFFFFSSFLFFAHAPPFRLDVREKSSVRLIQKNVKTQ
jgi:hypothetical protein